MAYQFNGALAVGDLLGSAMLFQAAVRVLERMSGAESGSAGAADRPLTEDEQMTLSLYDRAEANVG